MGFLWDKNGMKSGISYFTIKTGNVINNLIIGRSLNCTVKIINTG